MILMILVAPQAQAQRRKPKDADKQLLQEVVPPSRVFAAIERAWKAGNAQAIAGQAGSKKVHINMTEMGEGGGLYSKSQVYYLLKKMFKEKRQLKFEFVKYHNLEKPGRRVYAIAYRSYKNNRSNRVYQDKVYITLGKEGRNWVLVEIKTAR